MKYSILVVTYNNGKYLKKCLDSIFNQTYKNFEVIVVDDGSTDNTKQIVNKYMGIKYFYKKNTGVGDSRNFAISKVKTPYFLFVDSDDYIPNDLLEECEKYSNYDVLSFKAIKVDENYNEIEKLDKKIFDVMDGETALRHYMESFDFFLVPWGYVYKTSFFKKNNFKYSKVYVMEDVELTPIIIFKSKKVISINYYGYYYFQSNESITRTSNNEKILLNMQSFLHHYDFLVDYFKTNVEDSETFYVYLLNLTNLILWYGSTLKGIYFKKYIKELKKRKLMKNVRVSGIIGYLKKAFCIIDYRLYYFLYRTIRQRYRSYKKWKKQRKK